jgi:hypothetical protein
MKFNYFYLESEEFTAKETAAILAYSVLSVISVNKWVWEVSFCYRRHELQQAEHQEVPYSLLREHYLSHMLLETRHNTYVLILWTAEILNSNLIL